MHDTGAYRARDARGECLPDARGDRQHEARLQVRARTPQGGRRDDELERGCRDGGACRCGGFEVARRPEMCESTALGSTLLAGAAIGLFGWDLTRPEMLARINTRSTHFLPRLGEEKHSQAWRDWLRAVDRSRGWIETP